jgi:HD-GYP domain-containing protein (c-di-GMP phosphodiesterase class II)
MILAPVWRVEPDAVLARSIVAHTTGRPQRLLETGRRLSSSLVSALSRSGVGWVYVESELAEGISPGPLLSADDDDDCRNALQGVFDAGRRHAEKITGRHVDELCEMVAKLVAATREHPGVPLSHDPSRASDDPLSHALAAARIGLAIAEIVIPATETSGESMAQRLRRLGAGLLVHDIGTVATPPDVLSTLGPLNEMQREMVRWHPRAGEEILSPTVAPHVAAVVAQHHEWVSGGGYPNGLSGEDIHVNARIAAVAGAYDALAARSLTVGGRPSDAAVRMVRRWAGTVFDPAVVAALEQVIAPFPPGCPVLLSDGMRGVVVENAPGDPLRPLVRLTHDPDALPVAPLDRTLAGIDDGVVVTRALDHPAAPPDAKRPPDGAVPAAPSLAIRGLEAGGLLDARPRSRPDRTRATAAR